MNTVTQNVHTNVRMSLLTPTQGKHNTIRRLSTERPMEFSPKQRDSDLRSHARIMLQSSGLGIPTADMGQLV